MFHENNTTPLIVSSILSNILADTSISNVKVASNVLLSCFYKTIYIDKSINQLVKSR